MLKDLNSQWNGEPGQALLQPWRRNFEVRRLGNVILAGSKGTVTRYARQKGSERRDLVEPITRLTSEGAVMAVVFSPGGDFRRVVRELWPTLPPPLTPLKGELADRWLRLELAASLPPEAKPRITLEATDPAAAQTFVELYRALPAAAEQFPELGERRHELKRYLDSILEIAPAQIDGHRVTLSLPGKGPQLAEFRSLLDRAKNAAMESTRRRERMQIVKRIILAMHNYADVQKNLPPAAIRDEEGRPLLSWRVAILPYLEQGELYKQFHLDEPWDSPHNRTLIDKMPDVFADPDPRIRGEIGAGKTTFQVPVGAATIFYHNDGTKFGDITDGTSKTIMLVEVVPSEAAVWTQPEDWDVDMQDVSRGVRRDDRTSFVAAFADGSAHVIANELEQTHLRALLTRGGREVVDRP
jgi:hypothetical protein